MSEAATDTAPVAVERAARRRVEVRDFGIVLAFLALIIGLSLATDTFFTTRNILNILDQSAPVGIITCAVTICIIAGIFDLSTGAIFGVSAVVATKVANAVDPTVGLLAGVFAGLGLGIVNAIVIHSTRINSFIGTLATSIVSPYAVGSNITLQSQLGGEGLAQFTWAATGAATLDVYREVAEARRRRRDR